MKFAFIAKHRGIWPAGWLCGALGVSRGGFYAWLTRPRCQRSWNDEALGAKVRASFPASDRTDGARRVRDDMLAEGVGAVCIGSSDDRLQALLGGCAASPVVDLGERPVRRSLRRVDRSFEAAPKPQMDRRLHLRVDCGGLALCGGRRRSLLPRVVGWSMSATMTAQLVIYALVTAIWWRGKADALLDHFDRGNEYTSEQFQSHGRSRRRLLHQPFRARWAMRRWRASSPR